MTVTAHRISTLSKLLRILNNPKLVRHMRKAKAKVRRERGKS